MPFSQEAKNPLYIQWQPIWRRLADCYDGREAIKNRTSEYLPVPSGFDLTQDRGKAAYSAYLLRAEVPELLAPTVRGLTGIMHRKPATYELGPVGGLAEKATRDGVPLDGFHRRISRHVLKQGRYGIFVDAPEQGGDPFLVGYTADQIIDWETDLEGKLIYVALDESGPRRDDKGRWVEYTRWRVLELLAGRYSVSVYEMREGAKRARLVEDKRTEPVDARAQGLDFIPFVFVNTVELQPDPDDAPLAGVADAMLSIFRLDADYRHSLYLTSQPTPVAIGVAAEEAPESIGPSQIWILPEGGNAMMLEFTGAGVSALRQAIQDDWDKAIAAGAQLLSGGEDRGGVESGEALKIRFGSQTATLPAIAQNIADGLAQACRFAARMQRSAGEASIKVTPNLDFVEMRLSSSDITGLVESWLKGAISKVTLFENLQRGKIIRDDKTFEEEEDEIEQTLPDLPAPPSEGEGDDEDREDEGDEDDEAEAA